MLAAFREIAPGFGRSTEALLRNVAAMGSPRDVVVSQFLADLGALEAGRVTVILDDYHDVEGSENVRMIVGRMLERAPAEMHFILSGRGRPRLALGRLLAQGDVAELTVEDLRFTRSEIRDLFAVTYSMPLDDRALSIVTERTDGWAASLQLVAASIAATEPGEVGTFIDALSGAHAPIYDFLAEEVLTRLSPQTERVLMRAALVDRVRPELVTAALSIEDAAPTMTSVADALDEAERLGLLGTRGLGPQGGRRIHPLFREFLQARLAATESTERIRAMHGAIGSASEADDWLVSAKHYALAGMSRDGLRVLGSGASEALGTGAWGAAVEVVDLMPDASAPPAVKVIQARAMIGDGYSEEALTMLDGIVLRELSPEDRGLVGLTRAAIFHVRGDAVQVAREVDAVVADPSIPQGLHRIAVSWRKMLEASAGGCITDMVQDLRRLAAEQSRAGLHYFAGVTLHNAAYAELARGNYREARHLADDSVRRLQMCSDGVSFLSSTQSIAATAAAEMGELEEGLRRAEAITGSPVATADAIADAAYVYAVCGRTSKAKSLLARFDRGDSPWSGEVGSQAQGQYARLAIGLGTDELSDVKAALASLEAQGSGGIDGASRTALVRATYAVVYRSSEAPRLVQEAVDVASAQNAWRWMTRARMLKSVIERDGETLAQSISDSEHGSALALLEMADAVAMVVGSLAPLPQALERSILREPSRWMGALRRQLRHGDREDAAVAAVLIARYGTAEDVAVLREFEGTRLKKARRRGLAMQLIRRVSPTVRLHDLGMTSYEIGVRLVTLTETRRKGAALLLFLVTRPDLAAAKDQVMESLWPEQSPASALNSLHQTLFHLRRDIEPWFEEGSTAGYVRVESDLVFLDRELFQVDSVAFARQSLDILASGAASVRGPEMLRLYRGSFAPEFEYEEWSQEWRAHLHGIYLRLAHVTSLALTNEQRPADVIEVLTPVVAIDPLAFDLRATLISCLAATGSMDAAHAHYRSLAAAHERELGTPPPSYHEIVRGFPPVDT